MASRDLRQLILSTIVQIRERSLFSLVAVAVIFAWIPENEKGKVVLREMHNLKANRRQHYFIEEA